MKIAVVVHGNPVFFKGEKISAYHDTTGEYCLIVNDLTHSPPKKMGAFREWDYWYYVRN